MQGVKLGFCKGYLLTDDFAYLDKDGRKEVYTKTFYHTHETELDLLKTYIFEAVEIDKD